MRKLFVPCCVVLLLVAGVAAAQQDYPKGHMEHLLLKDQVVPHIESLGAKMPDEWMSCKDASDCALVSYNCSYESLAANKGHLQDVQQALCQTELCAWSKCSAIPFYTYSVACQQQRCVTKTEPFQSNKKN